MFETKFRINNLECGWDWPDLASNDGVLSYACEELEIPQDHIKKVRYLNEALELELRYSKTYFADDWYVNLQRQKSA